jgi:DNA-binding response OmpR family regulator
MKILIVEDHEDTVTAIMGHLELCGFKDVDCVTSVLSAFELLSRNNYDWVIIDLFLEGTISGTHLIDSITTLHPQTPIIVSTAMYLTLAERNSLIEKGVRMILDKPYSIEKLCDIISGKSVI